VNDLNTCIELLLLNAKENNLKEIVIRPSFHIYHQTLSEELDYLLWKNGFSTKTRELELAIDLRTDIEKQYSSSTLRSVKKSYKSGIVVKQFNTFEKFWEILETNLQSKYGRKPVHSIDEINLLKHLVGEDKVTLYAACLDNKVIAGILAFVANSIVVHAQYIASSNEFQEYRPLNAVIDFMAKQYQAKGYKYFNLGMVNEPGGEVLNEGLSRFKEGFGARGVLRETLQIFI
jgi:lipid II:glycine glycyltransferase (peptidoglycan interpeptide bridge formation enzyme)